MIDRTTSANFEVVFKVEVRAPTPEQAATIARDMLLDAHADLRANVHPIEYVKEADDWFPNTERGWAVYFGTSRWPGTKKPKSVVKPFECIEWHMHDPSTT